MQFDWSMIQPIIDALKEFAAVAMAHRTTLLVFSGVVAIALSGMSDQVKAEHKNIKQFFMLAGVVDGGLGAAAGISGLIDGEITSTTILLTIIGVILALYVTMKWKLSAVLGIGAAGFFGFSANDFLAGVFTDPNLVFGVTVVSTLFILLLVYGLSSLLINSVAGGTDLLFKERVMVHGFPLGIGSIIALFCILEGVLLLFGWNISAVWGAVSPMLPF
jgi:hypothetical protein